MSKIFIYGKKELLFNYVLAVKRFNHIPIVSTNLIKSLDCDALILAGGGDVYPFFYNQNDYASHDKDLKRDLCEFSLINYFFKKNLPILGICRGMQILNVFFGGTLDQKIGNSNLHYAKKDVYHNVYLTKNSCKNQPIVVNSAHRQAVLKLAKSLTPVFLTDDNLIEAFMHKNSKTMGVQFHPERMLLLGLPMGEIIFNYFFNFLNK